MYRSGRSWRVFFFFVCPLRGVEATWGKQGGRGRGAWADTVHTAYASETGRGWATRQWGSGAQARFDGVIMRFPAVFGGFRRLFRRFPAVFGGFRRLFRRLPEASGGFRRLFVSDMRLGAVKCA
jgi:hypothetical protein